MSNLTQVTTVKLCSNNKSINLKAYSNKEYLIEGAN